MRRWLDAANFAEQAFHAPDDALFAVGVHRFVGVPQRLKPRGTMFQFVT